MYQRIATFSTTHKRTLFALLFLSVFSVITAYATPPGSPYTPGETLDPTCAPGDTFCTVDVGGGTTYIFSTGLTESGGTVTNNLSTGVSGGQSIVGGTAASNNLTISSTSNGTKGKLIFGSLSAYDEVNDRLGISITSPLSKLHIKTDSLGVTQANSSGIFLQNSTAAAAGAQQISPALVLRGNGWTTASGGASHTVDFSSYVLPVQATSTPRAQWLLRHSVDGASYTTDLQYDTSTGLTVTGNLTTSSNFQTTSGSISVGNGVFITTSTGVISLNGSVGTAGQVLTSAGVGATPTWSAGPAVSLPSGLIAYGSAGGVLTSSSGLGYDVNTGRLSAGETLTRLVPIVTTMPDDTSITPAILDVSEQINTQATGTLTVNVPTSTSLTPYNGEKITIRIQSTNVQTFAWDAIYAGSLPATTTGGDAWDVLGFIYNSNSSKWDFTGSEPASDDGGSNIYTTSGVITDGDTRTVGIYGTATTLDFITKVDEGDGNFVKLGFSNNDPNITISGTGDDGSYYFNADQNNIYFNDGRNTTKGIEYLSDYSAGFTDRSLVDKAYVDNATGGGGWGTTGTVATLTGNSSLDLDGHMLKIANGEIAFTNSGDTQFGFNPTTGESTMGDYIGNFSHVSYVLSQADGHSFTGNVGIGTTPTVALDVVGDIQQVGITNLGLGGSYTAGVFTANSTGFSAMGDWQEFVNRNYIFVDDVNYQVKLRSRNADGIEAVIDMVGGANTTYSNINGHNFSSGAVTIADLAGTGSRAVLADATGVLSAPVSDRSVKQNIQSLDEGLSLVRQLNPVSFEYIDGWKRYGQGTQIGFIAQEIADVLPNSTFTTPSTGKMGYNEIDLIPILTKAVQEIDFRITPLPDFEDQSLAEIVRNFLDEVAHGIVRSKQLCAEDVCVDKTQLQNMIDYINAHQTVITPPPHDEPDPDTDPDTDPDSDPDLGPPTPPADDPDATPPPEPPPDTGETSPTPTE